MPPTVPLLLLHACDIPNALEMAQLVTEISKNGKASSNCKQRIQTLQHLLRLARKSPYLTSELFLLLLKQTRGNPDEQEIVTILQLWLALSFCLPCPEVRHFAMDKRWPFRDLELSFIAILSL